MFKPKTALVGFALITLLLAGIAVGRILGVGLGESLYLTALLLVGLGWITNHLVRRCTTSPVDREV